MRKTFLSVMIACAAVLAYAGVSLAVDANVEVNIGGASAQGEFWRANGAEYLAQELGCDPVCRDEISGNSATGIIKGYNCDYDDDGLSDDTITIRYQSVGSSFGCTNAPGSQLAEGYIDEATCDFSACADGSIGSGIFQRNTCDGLTSKNMTVGCSDIQCTSLIQTTFGYRNGRKGKVENGESQQNFGNAQGFPPTSISPTADMQLFSPVIVPFGFIANNKVTKTRCVAPVVQANTTYFDCVEGICSGGVRAEFECTKNEHCPATGDLLYDTLHFQCVPGSQRCVPDGEGGFECDVTGDPCTLSTQYELNPARANPANPWLQLVENSCPPVADQGSGDPSSECVGFYKCVGPEYKDEIGVPPTQRTCVGGTRAGLFCDKAQDCPADRSLTSCVERPIDNLSRMQALLLFSGKIKNWQDFGPWYPDLNVVLCMRNGGSGTHGTLDTRVMRGDLNLQTTTRDANGAVDTDPTAEAANFFQLPVAWHYRSSTTLTEDCVEFYDGGVGYVDADKALDNDFTSAVHHIARHEGVEPFRQKITFGEYPFWGGASCFFDNDAAAGLTEAQKDLATKLLNWASAQNERIEFPTNLFWASGDEMTVGAPNDFAYPTK